MWQNFYNRLRARLFTRYRVEFIEDESLRQTYAFSQRLAGMLVIGLTALLTVAVASICFVLFTPFMHKLIPGYEDPIRFKQQETALIAQLKESEEKFTQIQVLLESIQTMAGAEDNGPAKANPATPTQMNNTEAKAEPALLESPPVAAPPAIRVVQGARETESPEIKAYNPLFGLFLPLKGTLTNPFHLEKKHLGVDIIAAEKTLIRSAAEGYVIAAEYSYENGHVIGVMSPGDLVAYYKHNSRLLKSVGDFVSAGEAIAVIGNSGENSTGPHLHFELWRNGIAVDPALYLSFR